VAAARAGTLADRGQGDEGIRYDLAGRGIDAETIDEALAGLDPEPERAARLVERLGVTAKTAGQLRRKGFSEDSVAAALQQVGPEL
jgi:SOS response regulatory protein OraA/RecX